VLIQSRPFSVNRKDGRLQRALLLAAAAAVVGATVWVRAGPALLVGADSACYARVAREAAERQFSAIADQTLGGEPFLEHPPLALTAEGLWFRAFGASAETARSFGRCIATLLALMTFLVALAMADLRAASFSLLALPLLSGFDFESQIAMLELPLTLGLAIAALGTVLLVRRPTAGTLLLAFGFVVAALSKGPPALAALAILAWATWRLRLRRRWAFDAAAVALTGLCVALGAYEAARRAKGLVPFLPTYLSVQLLPSIVEGRGQQDRSLLFFVSPLVSWYLAGLLMLAPAAWVWSRRTTSLETRRLIELGFVVVAVIVLGQMLPAKKAPWYVHPAMLGFAWIIGGTASILRPSRAECWLTLAAIGLAALWTLGVGRTWSITQPRLREELVVLHRLPPPDFPPGVPRDVANCAKLGDWAAENTFAFVWRARAVPCTSKAPFVFDGHALAPRMVSATGM
jgi:4-amino-4-deoxy-L-arabinose transferase-like glycosyltransferase